MSADEKAEKVKAELNQAKAENTDSVEGLVKVGNMPIQPKLPKTILKAAWYRAEK